MKKILLLILTTATMLVYFPFLVAIVVVALPIKLVFGYDITNTKVITAFIAPINYLDKEFGKTMTSAEEREAIRKWDEKYGQG